MRIPCSGLVRRFAADRRGSFAIMFGLTSVVLVTAAGMSIDVARLYSAQARLNMALDAAVLSTTRDITLGVIAEEEAEAVVTDFVNGHYNGTPPIDPFPSPGSALIAAGDAAHATAVDFNGTPRSGTPDAGAYAYDPNGNPGWQIAAGFKDAASQPTTPRPPEDLQVN